MGHTEHNDFIIGPDDLILVTGATGFVGCKLVKRLLDRGFRNLRCFVRESSNLNGIEALSATDGMQRRIEVVKGNLLSSEDCLTAAKDVRVVFHLAAGTGEKSFPDAFMNSVVTTRNLLDASLRQRSLRRFLNMSSFVVYTNRDKPQRMLLDESCPVDTHPERRGDAYSFAKIKQDELVVDYGKRYGIPYVIVRPGYIYGPGKKAISGRVGIDTFGIFLHLGGANKIPFTYIDNCTQAIALAGLTPGVDGEVFNVVDDELPSSRRFLREYKRKVRSFKSVYVPHALSYALCYLWEKYSDWSEGQLPPTFNPTDWNITWKKTYYSNQKIKSKLRWSPEVTTAEGLERFFEACRNGASRA